MTSSIYTMITIFTHSSFGPHIVGPDATKCDEEQLFTGVIQTREEVVASILVELGLPSSICLNQTAIPDILRRGPVSQFERQMKSSENGVKQDLQFAL